MAYVIESRNCYKPTDAVTHQTDGGISIRTWLEQQYPGFTEFEAPTMCLCNGRPMMRNQWDHVILPNDVINFVVVPRGPLAIVYAVLVVAFVVVALALPVPAPTTPGETPGSDPVFSTKGQNNSIRLGEPIEVNYGKRRVYPSYASRPYFQYVDNDQFQYSLFCIGQGSYDIAEIQIGDTDIDSYQEVEYEVILPGNEVTLFPTNVFTSVEAGGQTLFAPNEPEFSGDGWVGPFATNPVATTTTLVQFDFTFPNGLYYSNDDGELDAKTITLEVQARGLDDLDNPIGSWTPILNPSRTLATTTPQRITVSAVLTAGRYEIRVRRTDEKDDSHRAGHTAVWEGMRSHIDSEPDWGDVTLLAVKIRATNNLNEQTQQAFNVICTRKLPIRDASTGEFGEPIATRSIIWAFVDVFRSSTYGAEVPSDDFFDWDELEDLEQIFSDRGDTFDWTFRDRITCWDAAKAICQVGRAVPMLVGSLISMRRDGPLDAPVTMFTPDNMVRGSFSWDVKLWELDEVNGYRVEYTDPDTGYKQEQVLAVLPGETATKVRDLRIPGCSNRTIAYRYGLYRLAVLRYLRQNASFTTGLEGYIPSFGDLAIVAHDVPRWSQHGYIVHALELDDTQWQLWLSEEVSFAESNNYQITLRSKYGGVLGPLDCYETNDQKQVLVDLGSAEIDFLLGGQTEPMFFVFSVLGQVEKYMRIVGIQPQGREQIKMKFVNNDARVHSFDALVPAARSTVFSPPQAPDLPTVTSVVITQISGPLQVVQIAWTAAFGAQYYVVQTSEDNTVWTDRGTTTRTALQLQARTGTLYVRVAGVNNGQGEWATASTTIGLIGGLDAYNNWQENTNWGVKWLQVLNAQGYEVKVYDSTASVFVLKRTVTLGIGSLSYAYDVDDATSDGNVVREHYVTVDPLFLDDTTGLSTPFGSPVALELTNNIPSPPTSPTTVFDREESSSAFWTLGWTVPEENDLHRIKVWVETSSGFDPEVATPVYDETISSPGYSGIPASYEHEIMLDGFGEHAAHYWRVALFDVWGNEISTNICDEQTIPAYT
ncbi:MAG: putative tail protein [Prokaryotic dsDNA virus sp.]|nr:MAG: putative tail protein [Prokaryotic dsDNA virus sp.]|tara:strand:- start:24486 stop:27626 length:3141 start_codon:yes stop_codon:yes gene_type:complete